MTTPEWTDGDARLNCGAPDDGPRAGGRRFPTGDDAVPCKVCRAPIWFNTVGGVCRSCAIDAMLAHD
jgi:hypothetical protein